MGVYPFETWDVFTQTAYTGNPLAVVMQADDLDAATMLRVTREFNLSETAFVMTPSAPDNTARVRIFTLGYEMPFAGHPTIGSAIAIARARSLDGALTLELNAGVFPVSVERGDAGFRAEFQNPNTPGVVGDAPPAAQLARALSLPATALAAGPWRPRLLGSGGVNFLYARADLDAVQAARVDAAAFNALGLDSAVGVFLYAEGGVGGEADFHGRMFAPNAGILEDPATGSAVASLPAHIALGGRLDDGEYRWSVEQGVEMGRPSHLRARVRIVDGAVASVGIGGAAVPIQRGEILI